MIFATTINNNNIINNEDGMKCPRLYFHTVLVTKLAKISSLKITSYYGGIATEAIMHESQLLAS